MTYQIITDLDKFREFKDWLPELEKGETYYFSVLARNKYIRDLDLPNIGTLKSDKHQCARWVSQKDRMELKLRQTEAPTGSYAIKGFEVPQEALAAYMTINPRSHTKASQVLLKRLADIVADGEENPNVYQESLTALHKAMSRKIFVDIDFDGVDYVPTMADVQEMINVDCLSAIFTRGGFHLLVRLDKIDPKYAKTWYRDISSLEGADIVGDNMIPIPGTYQGGFTPRLIKKV